MKKIFSILIPAILLAACTPKPAQPEPYREFRDDLMGTFMSITAYGGDAEGAVGAAFRRIEEIHEACDTKNPESIVSRLAADTYTEEPDNWGIAGRLYLNSKWVHHHTNGAFSPALGPLIKLWAVGTDDEKVPAQAEIDAALALCEFHGADWDGTEITPELLPMRSRDFDFGAIAKGDAAREAAKVMAREYGIEKAIIELGGDVYALGTRPDGNPWRIGLRSPLGDGARIGIIEVSDMAIMTSGSYERYFERDGKRYHHILDPATGCPAESGLLSVTVLYFNPVFADAFSTALFVMGLEKGREFLSSEPDDIAAIFITDEREIHLVGELAQGFKLEDNRFRIVT